MRHWLRGVTTRFSAQLQTPIPPHSSVAMLSFIIPAHNEELLVGGAIRAIQSAARESGEPFEVIVVDDASSDDTAAVATRAGARVVKVQLRQISAARNAGAAAAQGDMFIFVDADTVVTAPVVRAAVASLRAGAVGGGSAVRFDEPTPRYGKALLHLLVWMNRQLRLASGCFIFCARDAFVAVGGFDSTLFAGEEVVISRALGKQGRFEILEQTVTTSGRKLRSYSARQLFGTLIELAVLGRTGVRDRSRLAIWYGPRPPDPGSSDRARQSGR